MKYIFGNRKLRNITIMHNTSHIMKKYNTLSLPRKINK